MEILITLLVLVVGGYLLINGKRNNDPLNRKCAAEICLYVTSSTEPEVEEVYKIFMQNARYKTQANHVLSMVPALLIKAGYPKADSMSVVPLLRAAVAMIPR